MLLLLCLTSASHSLSNYQLLACFSSCKMKLPSLPELKEAASELNRSVDEANARASRVSCYLINL
jgi:hypothetical protein